MRIVIMQGPSGSGKSTWARRFHTGAKIVSADAYFETSAGYRFDASRLADAHTECFRQFLRAVDEGDEVIVDNTNTDAIDVAPYVAVARAHGMQSVVVRMPATLADVETLAGRNAHGVHATVIMRQIERIAQFDRDMRGRVQIVAPDYYVDW